MGLDGEHLDLDLALSEAESPLGHDICLFDRISVRLSGSLSTSPHCHRRFIALLGMHFSLQYLSLFDAVVLKFPAPILTVSSGAIFLRETLSIKEIIAGCEHLTMN